MVTSLVIQQSVWIIDPACICRKMNLRTFLGNLSYIIRKGERFKKRPRKISSYGKLLSHPDIYRYGCIIFIPNVIKLSETCQSIFAINQSCIGMIWGFCQLSEVFGVNI